MMRVRDKCTSRIYDGEGSNICLERTVVDTSSCLLSRCYVNEIQDVTSRLFIQILEAFPITLMLPRLLVLT
jgi:hypothetical protein